MKKLKLNLDDLTVNSFTASDAPKQGGTARGFTIAFSADFQCEIEAEEDTGANDGFSLDDIQCCTTPVECPELA
jgi:hypothetical protein